jgi:hypothetical protein
MFGIFQQIFEGFEFHILFFWQDLSSISEIQKKANESEKHPLQARI